MHSVRQLEECPGSLDSNIMDFDQCRPSEKIASIADSSSVATKTPCAVMSPQLRCVQRSFEASPVGLQSGRNVLHVFVVNVAGCGFRDGEGACKTESSNPVLFSHTNIFQIKKIRDLGTS
jgi:hypothetical protein